MASVGLNKWESISLPFPQVFSTMYNYAGTVFQENLSSHFLAFPFFFGAVGHKDLQIGQKVKGQTSRENTCGQISTLEGIFSHLFGNARTY